MSVNKNKFEYTMLGHMAGHMMTSNNTQSLYQACINGLNGEMHLSDFGNHWLAIRQRAAGFREKVASRTSLPGV